MNIFSKLIYKNKLYIKNYNHEIYSMEVSNKKHISPIVKQTHFYLLGKMCLYYSLTY